MEVGPEVY